MSGLWSNNDCPGKEAISSIVALLADFIGIPMLHLNRGLYKNSYDEFYYSVCDNQ
jgi:hypothetical protein